MILCRVSYTRIYALGVLYQTKVVYPFRDTKSDTSNREVNINFYNAIIGFYKVCVTDESALLYLSGVLEAGLF